ncbi:MAG: hypothetical protein RIC89_03855, partial [Pseudomonadales bacterium]
NAIPHYVMGLTGRKFPSPFSVPPGKGESSPKVNVLWALGNIAAGFLLLQAGTFKLGLTGATLAFAIGMVVMSLLLVKQFGQLYSPHQ